MESDAAIINPLVLRRLRVIGANAAFVYLYLLRVSEVPAGDWFCCTTKALVSDLGMGAKSIRQSLRLLEDCDIIEVDRAVNASVESGIRFLAFEPVDNSLPSQSHPVDKPKKLCKATDLLGNQMAVAESSLFRLEPDEPQVTGLLGNQTGTARKTGAYLLSLDLSGSGGSEEGGDDIGDIGFDEFWSLVPRKIAKSDALTSFVKALAKTDLETIVSGMKRYSDFIKQPDAPSPCYASTWLNQGRWTDDYPAPKAQPRAFAAQRDPEYYDV